MRIVAGAAKGRRLTAPPGADVRPTADRVKEALFSSLQGVVPGARVLDLYAGSGSLGLEALSRGASSVTFVERHGRTLEALRRNVAAVGLPGATVVPGDVHAVLAGGPPGAPFDLVLVDPPYREPAASLERVLAALVAHLAPGAVVVVERAARDGAPRWPDDLLPEGARRYGDTALHRAALVTVGSADVADGATEREFDT